MMQIQNPPSRIRGVGEEPVAPDADQPDSTPDEVADVARLLEVIEREREGRWARVLGRGILVFVLLTVVWQVLLRALGLEKLIGSFVIVPTWVSIFIGLHAWTTKKQRQALEKIALTEDIRSVGPLLHAMWFSPARTAKASREALVRLLPRVTEVRAVGLHAEELNLLARIVPTYRYDKHVELAVLMLNALTQVGTAEQLPAIERLLDGKSYKNIDPTVRTAAEQCRDVLRSRKQKQQDREQLLRAPQSDPSGVLLHVNHETPEADPDRLLRADISPRAGI